MPVIISQQPHAVSHPVATHAVLPSNVQLVGPTTSQASNVVLATTTPGVSGSAPTVTVVNEPQDRPPEDEDVIVPSNNEVAFIFQKLERMGVTCGWSPFAFFGLS